MIQTENPPCKNPNNKIDNLNFSKNLNIPDNIFLQYGNLSNNLEKFHIKKPKTNEKTNISKEPTIKKSGNILYLYNDFGNFYFS